MNLAGVQSPGYRAPPTQVSSQVLVTKDIAVNVTQQEYIQMLHFYFPTPRILCKNIFSARSVTKLSMNYICLTMTHVGSIPRVG